MSNPDETAARGNWSDPEFLAQRHRPEPAAASTRSSPTSTATAGCSAPSSRRTARATCSTIAATSIERRTRPSSCMAAMVPPTTHEERAIGKQRDGTPVHLMDIHLEKGMHCVDCHFAQDVARQHQAATAKCAPPSRSSASIATARRRKRADAAHHRPGRADTSGRTRRGGRDLAALRTPFGKRRFERARRQAHPELDGREGPALGSRADRPTRSTPSHPHYNAQAAPGQDRPLRRRRQDWSGATCPDDDERSAPTATSNMSCIACHSSWNPSCFGCHLPQKANKKMPQPAQRRRRHAQLRRRTTSRRCATTSTCWPATAT